MFIPATKKEAKSLNWNYFDIILITGDAYIDSPFIGVSVIGKILINAGYKVGIIAQPDLGSDKDITRLGEPELFWGITSGCVDSMVANYTATKKKRKSDDFTPGGKNIKRPDRAVLAYSNLVRRYFKNTKPLVLGGIEASLRRIAHYDYWSDKIRRSILFDAKADILAYGMGEKAVLNLADSFKRGNDFRHIKGICYISKQKPEDGIQLPDFNKIRTNKAGFAKMFDVFYRNNEPLTANKLYQKYDSRYLVQNPPDLYSTTDELDRIYALDFERDAHPRDKEAGEIKALETIRFSITTHRGCYGDCNFCAITVHQGKTVRNRSEESILNEAKELTKLPDFKGYILDVGGPTANMYGTGCERMIKTGACNDKRCVYPETCKTLNVSHKKQIDLLRKIRKIPGIKKVFVASGLRYDMILKDDEYGETYLHELIEHHISGQLKIAPEHTVNHVLEKMGKPSVEDLTEFRNQFFRINKKYGKNQFLTYYIIAAHPGCGINDMQRLKDFAQKELKLLPEQVQVFTPSPSTYSTLMYYTETDPFTGEEIFVEKDSMKKERQKKLITKKSQAKNRREYRRR